MYRCMHATHMQSRGGIGEQTVYLLEGKRNVPSGERPCYARVLSGVLDRVEVSEQYHRDQATRWGVGQGCVSRWIDGKEW